MKDGTTTIIQLAKNLSIGIIASLGLRQDLVLLERCPCVAMKSSIALLPLTLARLNSHLME